MLEYLNLPFIFPIVVITVVAWGLVIHPKYDDGIFGRVCLVTISLFGVVILLEKVLGGFTYRVSPEILAFLWGIAGFALRHAYRFVRWTRHGEGAWDRDPHHKA